MLGAESGGGLALLRVLGQELLEFAVEGGGFELGEGLGEGVSSCSASTCSNWVGMPDRTHTFTVRQPSCLIAASRRAPPARPPGGGPGGGGHRPGSGAA